MYFTTIVISALAAAGLSSASPSERAAKRAPCLVQPPSTIGFPINYYISATSEPAVSFQIPSNLPGPCTLIAKFPAGYPITSTGTGLVDFRATSGPAAGSLVGTVRFEAGTTKTINSFQCSSVMTYTMEIPDWAQGSVSFQDTTDAGLFMQVGDSC